MVETRGPARPPIERPPIERPPIERPSIERPPIERPSIEPPSIHGEGPAADAERLVLVLCNAPAVAASRIAHAVVRRRLAACVNILGGVTSIYRWDGAIQEEQESTLLLKTRASRVDELTQAIRELHPHDVPEVIAVALEPGAGNAAYLAWVLAETRGEAP